VDEMFGTTALTGTVLRSQPARPPCPSVPNLRHLEYFLDHARIENELFEGALDPSGGVLHPDQGRPGLRLTLRRDEAQPYRQPT